MKYTGIANKNMHSSDFQTRESHMTLKIKIIYL